jgi:hypothetical protein
VAEEARTVRCRLVHAGLGEPTAEALDSMEKSPNFDFFFGHYVVGLGKYEPDVVSLWC